MTQRLLFGTQGGSSSQSKYLVEFRAGKCTRKGKLVTPDKRKGLVYVQQTEDSLIHFCWKDRSTGATEDDLIMFPGDAEFEKVSQCSTGRVFVLKFKSNYKRCFYWMQEPKDDKDDDYRTKVNQFLNDPSAQTRSSGNGFTQLIDLTDDHDLNSIISGMSQRDLMQLFGGLENASRLTNLLGNHAASRNSLNRTTRQEEPMETDVAAAPGSAGVVSGGGTGVGAPVAPPTPSTPSAIKGAGIKPQSLAEMLNKINAEAAVAAGGSSSSSKVDSISDVLTSPEVLEPLLNNPELMARVKGFLPPTASELEGPSGSAGTTGSDPDLASQIKLTVKSPQFQQAVALFAEALASGQMGPIMTQFGMSDDIAAAAATGNMDEFVKALEKDSKKDKLKGGSTPEDAEMKE
ncbi:proteasomal ubiquitin receptor ADRM1-like [Tropilaelaps mercedesae]|uniref:Proteasomal ubiquitin receptor ADRM1 homolog n=1 Tax=Tropilaelaps mercedesae TaxID=418985 RepID=A0A1V9XCK0_9ACAR|nr:proteasomal ubiquitin receptor ADRM1-like [Tropilaelaps mercedesae]